MADHTLEIRSDKGVIEVFLDGREIPNLMSVEIKADPTMHSPLVSLELFVSEVTLEGEFKTEAYSGAPVGKPTPPFHHTTITASDGSPLARGGVIPWSAPLPWSHPDSDPVKDIEEAAKMYARTALRTKECPDCDDGFTVGTSDRPGRRCTNCGGRGRIPL